jgi:hypothetical protein
VWSFVIKLLETRDLSFSVYGPAAKDREMYVGIRLDEVSLPLIFCHILEKNTLHLGSDK